MPTRKRDPSPSQNKEKLAQQDTTNMEDEKVCAQEEPNGPEGSGASATSMTCSESVSCTSETVVVDAVSASASQQVSEAPSTVAVQAGVPMQGTPSTTSNNNSNSNMFLHLQATLIILLLSSVSLLYSLLSTHTARLLFLSLFLSTVYLVYLCSLLFLQYTQTQWHTARLHGLASYLPPSLARYITTDSTGMTLHEWMTDSTFFNEWNFLLMYFIPGLDEEQLQSMIQKLPQKKRELLMKPGFVRRLCMKEEWDEYLLPLRQVDRGVETEGRSAADLHWPAAEEEEEEEEEEGVPLLEDSTNNDTHPMNQTHNRIHHDDDSSDDDDSDSVDFELTLQPNDFAGGITNRQAGRLARFLGLASSSSREEKSLSELTQSQRRRFAPPTSERRIRRQGRAMGDNTQDALAIHSNGSRTLSAVNNNNNNNNNSITTNNPNPNNNNNQEENNTFSLSEAIDTALSSFTSSLSTTLTQGLQTSIQTLYRVAVRSCVASWMVTGSTVVLFGVLGRLENAPPLPAVASGSRSGAGSGAGAGAGAGALGSAALRSSSLSRSLSLSVVSATTRQWGASIYHNGTLRTLTLFSFSLMGSVGGLYVVRAGVQSWVDSAQHEDTKKKKKKEEE